MSDILADYKKRQLEWTLKLSTECPPHYVKQQVAQELEFLFCIETLWPLLRLWKELLDSPSVKATYIDFLNSTVVDGWFIIRRDCDRVEKLLSKKAYVVNLTYRQTTGRKRKQLDDKVYKVSIRRNETETTSRSALKTPIVLEEGLFFPFPRHTRGQLYFNLCKTL